MKYTINPQDCCPATGSDDLSAKADFAPAKSSEARRSQKIIDRV
jgi:hypothetical protein